MADVGSVSPRSADAADESCAFYREGEYWTVAYGGTWRVGRERAVAGPDARLRLAFHARDVHLVLGGRGAVEVLLDGRRRRTVHVDDDRLYTLLRLGRPQNGLLELRFTPGVEAYAFTFG